MPVYPKQSHLSKWHGTFAALFSSLLFSGCSLDAAAIVSDFWDARLPNTGAVVGYATAVGSLFIAAGQVSPTFQRFALAIALTIGAFFMGNLSPQIFPIVFSGDGPLFQDLPDVLVIALLCVAGFFAVLNKVVTFKKLADIREDVPERSWSSRPDRTDGARPAGLTEPEASSVDFFEFSQDALVVANAEGVVLELNRQAETMFGWSRKHLVGQPLEVLIPQCELARHMGPNDPPVHVAALRTVASDPRKLRGVRKDGSTFAVEVSLCPGRSGGTYAVVASIRMVTKPVPTNAASQDREFAREHTVDTAEHNQAEQERHALYANFERRLTSLIDNSAQSVNVSKVELPILGLKAEASPLFEAHESRRTDSADELADSQWIARWADEEKNARACALSLLCIIKDMKDLPEIDGSRLKVACLPVV